MQWKDVISTAEKVAGVALPVLGTALGGPLGGSVGGMLAKALGVANTPDAVSTGLQTNPDAAVKLAQIESDERVAMAAQAAGVQTAQIQADSQDLGVVNTTMQGEAKAEHWAQWLWRPMVGFSFAGAFLFVSGLCCMLAWKAVESANPAALSMIPLLVGAFVPLFGVPAAILGVAAWHRGVMQVEQAKAGHV